MPEFGTVLRRLRKEEGLSQKELSKKLGLAFSTISMYERGAREPNLEMLELIADFFNVDMDYLLGKSDIKLKSKLNILSQNALKIRHSMGELLPEPDNVITVIHNGILTRKHLSPDDAGMIAQLINHLPESK